MHTLCCEVLVVLSLSVSWKAEKWDRATELCNSTNEHALIRQCVCVCTAPPPPHTHTQLIRINDLRKHVHTQLCWLKQAGGKSQQLWKGKSGSLFMPKSLCQLLYKASCKQLPKTLRLKSLYPSPFQSCITVWTISIPYQLWGVAGNACRGPTVEQDNKVPFKSMCQPIPFHVVIVQLWRVRTVWLCNNNEELKASTQDNNNCVWYTCIRTNVHTYIHTYIVFTQLIILLVQFSFKGVVQYEGLYYSSPKIWNTSLKNSHLITLQVKLIAMTTDANWSTESHDLCRSIIMTQHT